MAPPQELEGVPAPDAAGRGSPNSVKNGVEEVDSTAAHLAKLSATPIALNDDNNRKDDKTVSECERLYGPYPKAIPIPFLAVRNEGREGDVPDASVINGATSVFDSSLPPDVRDVGTPDEWVPRDGRLVRLTGKHPFNVEPPMSVLHRHRFLTPSSLHYVRNHGACPKLSWDTHTLVLGGSGVRSGGMEFTMDEIAQMKPREFPVTLVCAGNRRKEQNMIRQTIGFNWGPAGVGTNVYKGVPLRDLLLRVGVVAENIQDWHVEFVGVEDLPNKVGPGPFPEEQWGKLVKYGTSIPLAKAMNPANDVLIAYQANGEVLQPDHGYPLRLIIPGYIGGRMIKWLKHINVIPHETKNHYHYHDNRILPPHITAEESLAGNWWYKPEYIFNELNINSAMARPDHNETLSITKSIGNTYTVSGYAYTGGGRMVTRVEVSTDGGVHWNLAKLERKERPTEYGMYWCWIWWDYEMPVADLVGCKEIWCRAWDDANNCQPDSPTWNLMGMGNNQVFRVKVHVDKTADGEAVFRFEHPTQPGQQMGGWMTRVVDKPPSAGFGRLLQVQGDAQETAAPAAAPPKSTGAKLLTMEEVAKHNTEQDCWIIVKDRVYDCTEYLELHPGGIESITINAGCDATEDFVAIHSIKATKMLEKYYIGDLDKSASAASSSANTPGAAEELVDSNGNKLALNPKRKTPFRLRNKIVLSRDSFLLDFELPTPEHVLGLPTGKHMFLSAKINGEPVLRRYTPISSNHDVGCVKFIIKAYHPCERFPEGGKMSQYLENLQVGDYLDMRGPVGEFEYLSKGAFLVDGKESKARRFNMIAGGTGITPVMQIAAEILRHPEDETEMMLIFGAREEGDLLMRSTLDEWAAYFPCKFKVHYILSDSWPSNWPYSTGFVDKALFAEYLFEAGDDVYNLMCGPPIMMEKGCRPNLEALGHKKDAMFSF
jgi:nitrate reductase (NAD(P)H)